MIDLQTFGIVNRPQPLHVKIASRIVEQILDGSLAPGDRLPGEYELANAFNVSRNVIREAIVCLRSDGIIESRQGLGAFVMDPKDKQVLRIHSQALDDRQKLSSLFELRGLLEIGAAGLAALRRTEDDLARIRNMLEKSESRDSLTDAGVDDDLEFHLLVAQSAGNQYLVEFLEFIAQRVRQSILAARAENDITAILKVTNKEHRVIYEALVSSDPDAARRAMQDHINGAASRLGLII